MAQTEEQTVDDNVGFSAAPHPSWLDTALGRPSARAKGSPDLIDMNQG